MLEIATTGASTRDPITNTPLVQVETAEGTPLGEVAAFGALGVSALPAPATAAGFCESVIGRFVGPYDAVVLGARDTRTAAVMAELAPGETCLHSTGDGFDSRIFCKDQIVSIVIGNDTTFTIDRASGKATLAVAGFLVEVSQANGVYLSSETGGAGMQIKAGTVNIWGNIILGGRYAPATTATAVLTGAQGILGVPATNVFWAPG